MLLAMKQWGSSEIFQGTNQPSEERVVGPTYSTTSPCVFSSGPSLSNVCILGLCPDEPLLLESQSVRG